MVKSAKSHLEEEDEADDYDFSSYRGEIGKGDGKSSEQKANTHRSKHSETEQRRRSKINERFQILRDLIPQNDQKRDKASFLLEVIEYIQFLQEKLHMYEGPFQGWTQEPTKLTPWKNHHTSVESLVDHSQVLKNGSAPEVTAMLTNVHNSIESDLGVQAQMNTFAAVGRGGITAQSVQESVSDAENMAYQLQSQLWQGQPCASECTAPSNTVNGQEEQMSKSGLVSSTFSQGILDNLTQALQSSGVDLSQTSISVQIDVSKQANSGAAFAASSSKDQESLYLNSQMMEQTGFGSCMEDSDQARKRLRTQKS
ncbi:transcription factor BIM2 [Ricinus communis]|uniref:Transcription factor BIM1, putative n=1 Tax=Ricinus communis TaxID=3988 RepID=B9SIX6_RICCO|nr:transcription factor BIM2 [Ricinus communis]XP_015578906.1 transcription factor BIM2 [Ricinus communis]EEF36465.1 Transcription factor BIM1, putative [Ricinus communis]|eukprot:XP_002525945.1 transcription factor BIM2 [Ricinus communis]